MWQVANDYSWAEGFHGMYVPVSENSTTTRRPIFTFRGSRNWPNNYEHSEVCLYAGRVQISTNWTQCLWNTNRTRSFDPRVRVDCLAIIVNSRCFKHNVAIRWSMASVFKNDPINVLEASSWSRNFAVFDRCEQCERLKIILFPFGVIGYSLSFANAK